MRKAVIAAVLGLLVAQVGVSEAGPVEVPIATTAGSRFAPPQVVLPMGASLRLVQLDPLARHDVVARVLRKGKPIFGSKRTLNFAETELIPGVERLTPATYPFTCSIHEFMSGTLIVQG